MNRNRQRTSAPSYITGEKGANRVRVFADPRTGMLYFEYRANGRKARTALGHRDLVRAKAQADELAARLRHPECAVCDAVGLAQLFDNYLREVTPTKGVHKQGHDRRAAKLLLEILGPAREADDLNARDVARYVAERRRRGDLRVGTAKDRPVGNRVIAYDLKFLKAVLNWGVGMGWLDRNPIQAVELPQEPSPRRPMLAAPQYEALLAVSEQVHPLFRLIVANETGHRIGAVRLLQCEDVRLDAQVVRWRAENDKIGYAHETWLTDRALEALRAARRSASVISEWVFPSPTDPREPVSRHLVRDWWKRGEVLAKLPPERGRGWHSLRRKFATELKHAPLKDLCTLGGWKDAQTILKCYQQADPVTMRRALETRQRLDV